MVALTRACAIVSHLIPERMQETSVEGYIVTWALWIDLIPFLLFFFSSAVGLAHTSDEVVLSQDDVS
jgi:hypothetical protein